jgi:pimeloyl-ACP methyl ester carboxylesterase
MFYALQHEGFWCPLFTSDARLLDSTAVIMKDCGHLPMIERPQEAAEHYLTFLKSK